MKKILTLLTALFFFGSLMTVQADYYVAGTMNGWNAGSNDYKMNLVSGTVYSKTLAALGANDYEFKITNGSWSQNWGSGDMDNTQSNVTLSDKGGNIKFTLSTTSDVTFYFDAGTTKKVYVQATPVVVPSYTFTSGTTIYYDFTAYTTTGINTYVGGNEAWYGSTSNVIAITLSSDWEVTASTKLWRSGASGWNDYYCTTLPTDGQDMIISTDGINYTWGTYGGGVLPPASVKLHGNITNPSWADTEEFSLAANEETASLTLTNLTKGNYEFGMKIADSWTSNGSAFTRANPSHAIASGSSPNCTFNADRNGDYTFTWTYATSTLEIGYPAIPSQSVSFNSLASQILKGSVINLANCVTSSGIDEPTYRFYIKEKNGSYGDAINANYNFNANGEYVVKVEALEYGEPVADDESEVVVYQSYTFTNGSTIYVDFSAMTEGSKGVNYPKVNEVGLDWDGSGAGNVKTITFTSNVTWTTMAEAFIKTEKTSWANQPFTVPGTGKNCVVVAEDGASYTWGTYVPAPPTIKMHGNFLGEWNTTDPFVVASGNATASLTLDIQTKGEKEFGMRIGSDDNWTSNGASITRASASAEIVAGSGNCKLNVDAKGEYTFTWTFASNTLAVTYPALPAQSVAFDGLASQVLKGTNVVFAATSSGIDNPGYRFYVREKNGVYGAAVTEYTFNALGEYEVKVEALEDNTGDPVASDVADVVVYQAHTFTTGTVLYVDFTAMTEGAKGVNLPYGDQASSLNYIADGAGTLQAVTFTTDVEWSTLNTFIKTEKAGWADLKFRVPENGENCVVVAADGASYTWSTHIPTICLNGTFSGAGWAATADFVLDASGDFATLEMNNLAEGTYEFKAVLDGNNWRGNGATFTRANNSSAMPDNGDNMNFVADVTGDYTFTWTYATNTLSVTYPTPTPLLDPIAPIGGKFIIDAKGDTAVFSRGNLQYHYGLNRWYCAEHQYDFLGEESNLQFGKEGYTGAIDLFGWSNSDSNYGRMLSNNDADYMNSTFVDWGGLFTGDKTWSTFNTSQMNYVIAHQKWTTLTLDPTPEDDENGDEIRGLVLFPYDWVMPAGYEQIHYSLHDWNDEQGFADNTILPSAWDALEAAGAVFMPMAGARAGYWGCTWNGDHENTNPAAWNPAAANSFDHVDNVGWYGYYWLSTPDNRSNYQHCANYLIFLGWGEGPTLADDDDIYYPPQVWSREKRRGNSVRLVNIVPRQYTVTYTAGEGEGTVPTDANKYLDGAEITLASATGLHKDGYVFAGWKFKDVTYSDTYTVNNVLRNEEIVFEAQWELDWTVVRTGLEINRYYTVCLPKEVVDVRGATFWTLHNKNMEGSLAYLEEETNNLPFEAGKPFIIQATADQLEVIYNGDATETPGVNGAIHGTLVYMDADALAAAGSDVYMLYQNELRPVGVNNHLDANRAYVKINELDAVPEAPQNAPGRRVVAMPMEKDVTTDINALNAAEAPVKMIIDGNLFILRGEKLYDATGRLVK